MCIELIKQADKYGEKVAILDNQGSYTYRELLAASSKVAACLLSGLEDLCEARVAFLVPSGFEYVATQWGIWRAGGIAVPISASYPLPEIEYVVDNSEAQIVVVHPDFKERIQPVIRSRNIRLLLTTDAISYKKRSLLPQVEPSRRAMIVYTSGTTSKPKGVVTTHKNIEAQVVTLVSAWGWTENDHILHVLPLHHVHGIINALTCALWSGATCEMLPRFSAAEVWSRFMSGKITLFMAVPTIYEKLIAFWDSASPEEKRKMSESCSKLRLMVSGSAPLPVSTFNRWKSISGHMLLERYGMTEIGMALSNPLSGKRIPGYVGRPLPGVEVRLVDDEGKEVKEGIPGEIQVRGPGVFLEYWKDPESTQRAFKDGWFCTGDIALEENGIYRILGRRSVDIIKTGGYKVSALEIEDVLRAHPFIKECAVVGVRDAQWGESVCAAIVLKEGCTLNLDSLRSWAKERLAVYKIPSRMLVLKELPRNAMGKVVKPDIVTLFMVSG
ncbi:MAG: long-chain-fatty-acid--CoA ligase [Deltaproteobacteria bacterium]|jgi:malonyl-CoA/methylmalonyl-CoA synthetase|nr:MAG: long-chain-fatty-acid--CoA ligase [Deltaproteobacteria bacterium]